MIYQKGYDSIIPETYAYIIHGHRTRFAILRNLCLNSKANNAY